MKNILLVFICLFLIVDLKAGLSPLDSIGTRTINNKTFIIHKVESGETLYALSRKYNTTVNEILAANPDSGQRLKTGEEIRIPLSGKTAPPSDPGRITHIVKAGETLYGISRKYNVSIIDLKEWNSLRSNTLSIGDRLRIFSDPAQAERVNEIREKRKNSGKIIHIVNEGETLFSISRNYGISVVDIKDWNRFDEETLYVGQELVVGFTDEDNKQPTFANELQVSGESEKNSEVKVRKKETEGSKMVKGKNDESIKKVTEKGNARVIEGSESTKKYLALHRTAPIGTIMQVKNAMNDLSVFVRVIGKLPETGENRNLLLKISKTAYDRLGAYDDQFRVEITYHP